MEYFDYPDDETLAELVDEVANEPRQKQTAFLEELCKRLMEEIDDFHEWSHAVLFNIAFGVYNEGEHGQDLNSVGVSNASGEVACLLVAAEIQSHIAEADDPVQFVDGLAQSLSEDLPAPFMALLVAAFHRHGAHLVDEVLEEGPDAMPNLSDDEDEGDGPTSFYEGF
jgi:hypothetical protein